MRHSEDTTSALQDFLRVLSERRWVVIGVTLVAIAIGVAFDVVKKPTYQATATIKFQDQSQDISVLTPGVTASPDINASESAAANSRIVTRSDVVARVQRALQSTWTLDRLRGNVSAVVQPDSNLIAITASAGSAEQSARLANAFARQTALVAARDARRQYEGDAHRLEAAQTRSQPDPLTKNAYRAAIARLAVLGQVANPVQITRLATPPDKASSPRPIRDIPLAAVLGLLIGIAAAFTRHRLDRRVNDRDQVQAELGLPLLGYVREDAFGFGRSNGNGNGNGTISEPQLESFRILRTNAAFLSPNRSMKTAVVTSAIPQEGKSTVAAGYAYVAAAAGRRTLLVDCDFRKPVLSDRFGLSPTPGLHDYLVGEATREEIIRFVEVHRADGDHMLNVIPAGRQLYDPAEMIGSEAFRRFVDEVSSFYDLVVFDSAPLLPVSDTLQLILHVDAVLLCARLEQTTRNQLRAAKEALDRLPPRPSGVVVTGARRQGADGYGYGYYGYGATEYPAASSPSRS